GGRERGVEGRSGDRLRDPDLPGLCGQFFFRLPRTGTWQIAEVGFLLRNGEFVPAGRSRAVAFPPAGPSGHTDQSGLLVGPQRRVEVVGSVWEQERILQERRRPHLRPTLRVASFAFAARAAGQHDWL